MGQANRIGSCENPVFTEKGVELNEFLETVN